MSEEPIHKHVQANESDADGAPPLIVPEQDEIRIVCDENYQAKSGQLYSLPKTQIEQEELSNVVPAPHDLVNNLNDDDAKRSDSECAGEDTPDRLQQRRWRLVFLGFCALAVIHLVLSNFDKYVVDLWIAFFGCVVAIKRAFKLTPKGIVTISGETTPRMVSTRTYFIMLGIFAIVAFGIYLLFRNGS